MGLQLFNFKLEEWAASLFQFNPSINRLVAIWVVPKRNA